MEVIASSLHGCHRRQCRAVDLGANNGWFTMLMQQQGADVIAVEPQADLARAIEESRTLNCIPPERLQVVSARACARATMGSSKLRGNLERGYGECMKPVAVRNCTGHTGWRSGGGRPRLHAELGAQCAAKLGLPSKSIGVPMAEVLLERWPAARNHDAAEARPPLSKPSPSLFSSMMGAASSMVGSGGGGGAPPSRPPVHIDLIKMDADGPEGGWLEELDALLCARQLTVGAIVVEASFIRPALFQRLQHVHNMSFYRFDQCDGRRLITSDGWDALSPVGTMLPLNRLEKTTERWASARFISRYSPTNVQKMGHMLTTPEERAMTLGMLGNASSRADLEDEVFAARALRHVFRAKPNLSLAQWVALMQPLGHERYESHPPTWLITREPYSSAVPTVKEPWQRRAPEFVAARSAGYLKAHVREGTVLEQAKTRGFD